MGHLIMEMAMLKKSLKKITGSLASIDIVPFSVWHGRRTHLII